MNKLNDLQVPLVVDLDGTLIRTDLLFESANHSFKNNPLTIFSMAVDLFRGKSILKTRLAQQFEPKFSEMPINDEVVEWLETESKRGRQLVLATASHEKIASQAAQYFGFFDEVLATDAGMNLKSTKKRDVLVQKFGEKGFDYVGDAPADKPIWKVARYSYVVSPSRKILNWLNKYTVVKKVFNGEQNKSTKVFVRALRPHQWAKNLLIFVPILTAHLYSDLEAIGVIIMPFLSLV